jgi:glucosamine--fructose-6-phosphate aminotransferase (isomerizing)
MTISPYISDILAQPAALRELLDRYSIETLAPIRQRLEAGEFDRIVITGMGASYTSAYPAWLRLCQLPIPVLLVPTAELVHYATGQIGRRTLLVLSSQSGRSVEIVRLLDLGLKPACTLGFVNDLASPLAQRADAAVPVHAGAEHTVSTKTYTNMLAAMTLGAVQLIGGEVETARAGLRAAADRAEEYLSGWEARVEEIDQKTGRLDQAFILGRGASLAAVWTGSLINKEAAKCAFEGSCAADFRHGPLELASPALTLFLFAGEPAAAELNRGLAIEVIGHGGRVLWIAPEPDPEIPTLVIPAVEAIARPVVEILPMQMLTIAMARRGGLVPGAFRYVGKVTVKE